MANNRQTFGDFIRDARVEASLSLRELARRVSVAPSYLSDIENDRRIPSEDVLVRLASVLSIDLEESMGRAGRLGEDAERTVRRSPEAVRLFRVASRLGEEDLRKLRERAEKMADEKE